MAGRGLVDPRRQPGRDGPRKRVLAEGVLLEVFGDAVARAKDQVLRIRDRVGLRGGVQPLEQNHEDRGRSPLRCSRRPANVRTRRLSTFSASLVRRPSTESRMPVFRSVGCPDCQFEHLALVRHQGVEGSGTAAREVVRGQNLQPPLQGHARCGESHLRRQEPGCEQTQRRVAAAYFKVHCVRKIPVKSRRLRKTSGPGLVPFGPSHCLCALHCSVGRQPTIEPRSRHAWAGRNSLQFE